MFLIKLDVIGFPLSAALNLVLPFHWHVWLALVGIVALVGTASVALSLGAWPRNGLGRLGAVGDAVMSTVRVVISQGEELKRYRRCTLHRIRTTIFNICTYIRMR